MSQAEGSCQGAGVESECCLDNFFAQAYKSLEAETGASAAGTVDAADEPAGLLVQLLSLDCPVCSEPLEITLSLCSGSCCTSTGLKCGVEWEPVTLLCDPATDLGQKSPAAAQLDAFVLFREVGSSVALSSGLHIRVDRRGRLPTQRLSLGGVLKGGSSSVGRGSATVGGFSGGFVLRPFGQAFAEVGRAAAAGEAISVGIIQVGASNDSGEVDSPRLKAGDSTMGRRPSVTSAADFLAQLWLQARIVRGESTAAALLTSRPTSHHGGLGQDDRDEAYVWLNSGHFSAAAGANGHSEPNVEIVAQVVDSNGSPVPGVIANLEAPLVSRRGGGGGGGSGEAHSFRSRVMYHRSQPVWDQLIRLDLSRLQPGQENQLALEAWHRTSRQQRGDRCLGWARLPLVALERGVVCLCPAGSRTVLFHDSDASATAAATANCGSMAASPSHSAGSRSTLCSFDEKASSSGGGGGGGGSSGKARSADSSGPTNRASISLDFCTSRRSTSWRISSLLQLPYQQQQQQLPSPSELRLEAEDERDLLACFPGLLRALLIRVCAQESSVSDPAFSGLVRLLALAAKRPPQAEAALLTACLTDWVPPAGLHRILLRHLGTEVHRDFRLPTGAQAVMQDLYASVRPVLRLVAFFAVRENFQRSDILQEQFDFLFRAFRQHPIRTDNILHCKFAAGLFTDCLPLLVEAAEPRWLWQQLWRVLTDLRAGQLSRPSGLLRFDQLVEADEFWAWPDTRLQLAEVAADLTIEALTGERNKIEDQVRPANLSALDATLRPLNELLRRLGGLEASAAEPAVQLLAQRRILRPLTQTCALVAFDRPIEALRTRPGLEPRYLRLFLTAIVSLMELFNRSQAAWQAWMETADRQSASAAAFQWSEVIGADLWPTTQAAKTDLADEAGELLQLLSGLFDQHAGRWGHWNSLLLLESAVAMETLRRLTELLPLESLSDLARCALASLFSFIQQPQATSTAEERRRHPRLAALERDLRLPALEAARSVWRRLPATIRADLAPSLTPKLLRCAAAARPNQMELQELAVSMLADVLQVPETAKASALELTLAINELTEQQRADEGFAARFQRLLSAVLKAGDTTDLAGLPESRLKPLVSLVGEQLGLLRESSRRLTRNVVGGGADEPVEDAQALALYRLHRFYRLAGLPQLAWRCLLRLAQLQERSGRLAEAACCLASTARSLDWSDEPATGAVVGGWKLPPDLRDCQTQSELKERLLMNSMEQFRRARLPMKAKQQAEELRQHYRDNLLDFQRERTALLLLSELCQQLDSPTLSERRQTPPTYFLAVMRNHRSNNNEEVDCLPAGMRCGNDSVDRAWRFVCTFPDGASLDEAAVRLERLLPDAAVRPATESHDGLEQEDFVDDLDGDDADCGYSPGLCIRLHSLTPVPEPPMPGLINGGGGSSSLSAVLHHRHNDVRRFIRFESPSHRRRRRLLWVYEVEESMPAPVRLLPARLVESLSESPAETAARSVEASTWELRCAARDLVISTDVADSKEAIEDWQRLMQLVQNVPSEFDTALAELRCVGLDEDADEDIDAQGADNHRTRLLLEARGLLEQAARCLELLCRRRPTGVGVAIDVAEVSTRLLQQLQRLGTADASQTALLGHLERLATGATPPVVPRYYVRRTSQF